MKKLFNFLSLFLAGFAVAQETPVPLYANVNLINVTDHPFDLAMEIVSPDTGPENFKMTLTPGASTGLFSQPPGKLEVEIKMEDFDKLDGHLKLAASEANVYAVHLLTIEKKIKGEVKKIPTLKIRRVESASEAKGFSLTLVSFCAESKLLTLGGKQVRIEPGATQLLPGWSGKGFEIKFEGETIKRISQSTEPSPFLLLIHENEAKELQFQHFRYEFRD